MSGKLDEQTKAIQEQTKAIKEVPAVGDEKIKALLSLTESLRTPQAAPILYTLYQIRKGARAKYEQIEYEPSAQSTITSTTRRPETVPKYFKSIEMVEEIIKSLEEFFDINKIKRKDISKGSNRVSGF